MPARPKALPARSGILQGGLSSSSPKKHRIQKRIKSIPHFQSQSSFEAFRMSAYDVPRPPHCPSQEEQEGYYYGLASRPKLVARSSTDPWAFRQNLYPVGKLLSPVGQHPIAELWNNPNGSLRGNIIAALRGVQWTVIDILRLGYQPDEVGHPDESKHHPVTLLISVEKNSTSWEQGYAVVTECRRILQQNYNLDVHCEMKEAHFFHLASPPAAPPTAPKLQSGTIIRPVEVNSVFSEYLGHSITSFNKPTREGTKCLYLRRRDTGQVLALTCRHIFFDETSPNEDYRYNETNIKSRVPILQPGNSTLAEMMSRISNDIQFVELTIKSIQGFSRMGQDAKNHLEETNQATLRELRQAEQKLKDLEVPATRIIGHLLFSPKFGASIHGPQGPSIQWLRDWALIELHQGKHTSPLAKLENLVTVGTKANEMLRQATHVENVVSQLDMWVREQTFTVLLQGMVPEALMRRPTHEARSLDGPAIMVAKYGRASNFTIGLANNVMSLKRVPGRYIQFVSEE